MGEKMSLCNCGVTCMDNGEGKCRYTMPLLPFPRWLKMPNGGNGEEHRYDADQMREYAIAAINLATPAQTVDVEAVREVINDMQEWLLPLDIGAWQTKLSQAIGDKP